ncbi:MAG: hypothetical protein ACHQAY_03865 [Hyphomicrobiales bacterium]
MATAPDSRAGAVAAMTPPASEVRRERLAIDRFIERALQEAYADAFCQKPPARFNELLDELSAIRGDD